jgi:hypothetical protein
MNSDDLLLVAVMRNSKRLQVERRSARFFLQPRLQLAKSVFWIVWGHLPGDDASIDRLGLYSRRQCDDLLLAYC